MYINVYSGEGAYFIKIFKTKKEADREKFYEKNTEVKASNSKMTVNRTSYCKRICCYTLKEFMNLDNQREGILEYANQCKANRDVHSNLLTQYFKFWWEHRNVED